MNEALKYLDTLNINNEYIVIALSGGPDSMALLNVLLQYRSKHNINIVCAHVNHNLRKESDDEKAFVEDYCKKHNIIFEYTKLKKMKKFSEEKARKQRYEFFDNIIDKYNSRYLFTAHHGDDLIETILMRIVRGSNLRGYAGISKEYKRHNYTIVRLLLNYTKEDILLYLNANNIPYVIDNTNLKDEYTRNRYRHNILPFLKSEDKNVHLKFLKFSEMLLESDSFIESIANNYLKKIYINNTLNRKEFIKLDKIIEKRILHIILYSIYKDEINLLNDKHIDGIFDLIYNKKPNVNLQLPNNIIIKREYDNVSFDKKNISLTEYKIPFSKDIILPNNKKIIFLKNEISDSNYICRLNSNDIKLPLIVRNRYNGDKIYVKNLNGRKKIKDIFIDSKIPKEIRDSYPIVTDSNNNILWIPGIKKSKYSKEKNEKYDIIIKYVN